MHPRWRVLQRVVYSLIEDGKAPSQAAIAKAVGLTRNAIWRFFSRHPGFQEWLDGEMRAENAHLIGPLARRHFFLGMQGSVASAEFCAKLVNGHFTRGLIPGALDGDGNAPGQVTNINILVPRPDMPNGGTVPKPSMMLAQTSMSVLQDLATIPQVAIKKASNG